METRNSVCPVANRWRNKINLNTFLISGKLENWTTGSKVVSTNNKKSLQKMLDLGYFQFLDMEESEECSVTPPDPTIQFVLEQVIFMQVDFNINSDWFVWFSNILAPTGAPYIRMPYSFSFKFITYPNAKESLKITAALPEMHWCNPDADTDLC